MFRFIDNFVRRRRLRPVVIDLPRLLKKKFGGSDFYTPGQVTTATNALKLKPGLMPAAHAIALTPQDFSIAEPDLNTTDYQNVRAEIARLFHLDEWRMNCRTLLGDFRASKSSAYANDASSGGVGGGGPGGGLGGDAGGGD